jgi:hypothetical protein
MPYGYKQRLNPGSRPNYGTDGFSMVYEGDMAAALNIRFFILPAQSGFGASYGRKVNNQPDMAGYSQTIRMGDPLAVKNKQIRISTKPIKSIENHRTFTKTQ